MSELALGVPLIVDHRRLGSVATLGAAATFGLAPTLDAGPTVGAAPTVGAVPAPLLEIRMLGRFQVRRPDGSIVDPGEWRTGKAADLVRLLALQGGEPVPAQNLVATLWPGSDQRRGHASLRTAASRVRQVLGGHCLERSLGGLRLRDVWVDVTAFRSMAAKVHRLAGSGQLSGVNAIAREADALYRGDLRAHDDGADWAQAERQALATMYQILLCDAAEAAVTLDFARDAVDFAGRALVIDPFSERASRLLMRGHAEMGEISLALREFERCRTLLADELGIDPSPQTSELHLFLLRSERPAPAAEDRKPHTVDEWLADGQPDELSYLGDPDTQARSKIQLAVDVCIPQRQFVRARRYADEAATLSDLPELRSRAIVASWLPDTLFGRAAAARAPLAQAARLAEAAGDRLHRRRLEVLRCLIAHDIDGVDFEARWAHAAARCEAETDVNWGWALIRIATERGDLESALLATKLPVSQASGWLARQLHTMASACLRAELGEIKQATLLLRTLTEPADPARSLLMLPEALARLVILEADQDLAAAESYLERLDRTMSSQPAMPREAYLRQLATAAIQSAHGRAAAAAASAAGAAEVAEANGLVFLTAKAHELCSLYAARAHAGSARGGGKGTLRLALSLVGR